MTIHELNGMANDLYKAECGLADAEQVLFQNKITLARAKETLDLEVSQQSLALINSGQIDGKNDATRRMQLDSMLAETEIIKACKQSIASLEDAAIHLEWHVALQKAQVHNSRNLFEAATIMARRAAENQAESAY